jgi:hypothetical protein
METPPVCVCEVRRGRAHCRNPQRYADQRVFERVYSRGDATPRQNLTRPRPKFWKPFPGSPASGSLARPQIATVTPPLCTPSPAWSPGSLSELHIAASNSGPSRLLEGARGLAHRAPHGDWHTVHRTGIGTSCTARGLGHRAPHGKEVYSVHST